MKFQISNWFKSKKPSEFTRHTENGVWIESQLGFKVLIAMGNHEDNGIFYEEGDRQLGLDACFWHDSEDRNADLTKMTVRQLGQYFDRTVTVVQVPRVWKWFKSEEIISAEDRLRILDNVRRALEFENQKPRFVEQP